MSRHAFLAALIVVAVAVAWLLVALERARSWGAGFSIGAVTFRTPPADADDMLHRADAAMYVAKQRGNQVVSGVA